MPTRSRYSFRIIGIGALACLLLLLTAKSAWADFPWEPSGLSPSRDTDPVVTLHTGSERRSLSRAEIETLPLYEGPLRHFEGIEGQFAGVWLDELLAEQGLDHHPQLRFIAHDDYTVFLSRQDRRDKRFLLATRLDGEPLTLATFGPTMLVVPADAEAIESGKASMTHWIWAIRDIIAP